MANKQIFSYGNGGNRKIGHSKFDMGFEHIMSANFGGLHPAACFETLPDDYWSISDNTTTLLKPLTAPSFTRINQNWYGAYVRNQQIWKYWNDYISNGTAFGDVYGNNVTNQALQNVWDVPSIPTSYLQSILKVGLGNATPVFTFCASCNANGSSGDTLARMIVKNTHFFNTSSFSGSYRVTDLFYLLLQVDTTNPNLQLAGEFVKAKNIGLTDYAFDVWLAYDSSDPVFLFSFYCSLRQWLCLRSTFHIDVLTPQNNSDASSVGEDISDDFSYGGYADAAVNFRFFADRISPEPKTSTSAFVIEKSDYQTEKGEFLKSLDFYPRITDTKVDYLGELVSSSGSEGRVVYQCIQSPYWGFRYVFNFRGNNSSRIYNIEAAKIAFNPSSDPGWWIDSSSLFGLTSLEVAASFFEGIAQSVHYLGVAQQTFYHGLDSFCCQSSNPIPLIVSTSGITNYYYCTEFGKSGSYSFIYNNPSIFHVDANCDIRIYFGNVDSSSQVVSLLPNRSFASRDSLALGYDSVSMFVYLCRNSSQLLDDFGLKVDPLSQRPFADYRFELTNSLPFFAYSKVWHDNFRNSVVSSPELDYSASNGPIMTSEGYYTNFVFGYAPLFWLEPSVRPSRYQNKVATDFVPNGWTLEITTFPRNAQADTIHTHLPIRDFESVLTILVGHNFDRLFCSTLQYYDLNVYDYYMPSYYNGLLHLKYQNFNKDYFTSAMLDPMSGANQVALGSTINELRQAEVEQHWWERTAMYRSIKSWFQGTYGITPIELPEDSRITGSDHIDVNIGEVIQTSGTTPESPQGTRTGLGGCRGSGSLCHGHANEHGWILILCSHTIESQYLQVYDKMWDVKESFLDYPTVDFAGIGNESILEKELNYTTIPTSKFDYNFEDFSSQSGVSLRYLPTISSSSVRYRGRTNPIRKSNQTAGKFNIANGAGTSLDNIFGFIPRYSSYKFKFDQVSGQFRHELNFWHTFKRYLTNPILCHEFVNWEMAADDDDINRIFAVSDDFLDDKFAIDCFINATVDRALPFVCVPMSH